MSLFKFFTLLYIHFYC